MYKYTQIKLKVINFPEETLLKLNKYTKRGKNMYITREGAAHTIYEIINSGIIDRELEDDLTSIVNCIEAEKDNLFIWGADDEVTDLFISKRADLITPEREKHCDELYETYKIK